MNRQSLVVAFALAALASGAALAQDKSAEMKGDKKKGYGVSKPGKMTALPDREPPAPARQRSTMTATLGSTLPRAPAPPSRPRKARVRSSRSRRELLVHRTNSR